MQSRENKTEPVVVDSHKTSHHDTHALVHHDHKHSIDHFATGQPLPHIDMRDMKDFSQLQDYLARMPFGDRLDYLSQQVEMSFSGKKLRMFSKQLKKTSTMQNWNNDLKQINNSSQKYTQNVFDTHMKSFKEFSQSEQEQKVLDYISWYAQQRKHNKNQIEKTRLLPERDIKVAQSMNLERA